MTNYKNYDMESLDFTQCNHKVIKKYYEIFDNAYLNLADAKKVENEHAKNEKITPIYLIVSSEEEREVIVLPDSDVISSSYDFEIVEEEFTQDYARKCQHCGAYFEEGYLVGDYDTYCEDGCLYTVFKDEAEYLEAYEEDEAFWTTFWE